MRTHYSDRAVISLHKISIVKASGSQNLMEDDHGEIS